MGLFDAIKHAIFDHGTAATSTPSQAVPPAAAVNPTAALSVTPAQSATQPAPSPQPAVDVEAILAGLAASPPLQISLLLQGPNGKSGRSTGVEEDHAEICCTHAQTAPNAEEGGASNGTND